MDALENVRKEIDSIDRQLVELFEKRMEAVLKVAQYKKENNIPILNKNREEEVISKNLQRVKNRAFEKPEEEFLKSIMSISRKLQAREIFEYNTYSQESHGSKLGYTVANEATCIPKREDITAGFQGVAGAFGEEALIGHFGDKVTIKNFSEFEDVFIALKNNEIDYGVLPIENSSTGGISEVYDLIRKYGFFIVGERILKVNHNLIGLKGTKLEDIKEVYSHPQGLQQCREFLRSHPNWECIPYRNTAASAEMIKNENNKEKAAIGSKRAAEAHGLEVIETNINYNKSNYTKFIIIGKNLELEKDYDKITIILSLPHKAGALYNILSIFTENNLSMVKIESRPILDKPFEYFFYIDFEGNLEDKNVKEAIRAIRDNSYDFKLLGNYKAHNTND
ncbi:P-protein [Clostridium homopropionicum DSM 5847]|uniref:Bifunctional chorismate mutase/prephenate dehydratase n=1 Tax=Clostridium homopropionicum DSM 5847 TaxID=1121318 RepID=A0A0L6Z7D3_9CLOT|nr:prephenate dehydratase [Clostridium homopropionicum]KOA18874.1 P-protein [Clostridium homopropionicum DSM 5847]SFG45997.1 chorismate mutase [Clostridium homopropionicum]